MSWIYFIQAGEGGQVKIGRAANPYSRMADLQIGCPERLRLLSAMLVEATEAAKAERALHSCLAKWRGIGEWFQPSRAVLRLAESYSQAHCDRCNGVTTSAQQLADVGPCFVCEMARCN